MRIRTNMIANFAGQGWAALMSVLFIPVYVQLLGIESFALIGFFTMMQAFLTVIDFGVMPVTTREMARFRGGAVTPQEIHDLLRSFGLICLGIAIVIAGLLWLGSGAIAAGWLNAERLTPETAASAIALMGVLLGLRLGENLYRSCLVGLQRQVSLNVATALFATLRGAGAVAILLWVHRSIVAFFLWQILVSLLFMLTLAVLVRRLLPAPPRSPRFSSAAVASVGRFAAGMMGINVLALILTQLDKVILSTLLPLQEFGYYMFAVTVTAVMFSLVMPITQAVFPAMVEQAGTGAKEDLARTFHGGAQVTATILGPLGLALVFLPEPLIFAWSGDAALAASTAPLVSLIAIGTLLNILMQVPYHLQVAHGWTSLTLWSNIAAVLLLAPSLLLLVPEWGSLAAAAIWAVLNAGYVLIVAPLMFRRLLPQEKWRWYLHDLARPLFAATVVLVAARLIGPGEFGRVGQALYVAIAGLAAFLAAFAATPGAIPRLKALLLQPAAGLP